MTWNADDFMRGVLEDVERVSEPKDIRVDRKQPDYGGRPEAEAPRPRLVPIPWAKIHLLAKRQPLIQDILDVAGMSIIFGASNCGKTFAALDIAAHIPLGWQWRGREVRKGAVLYIAAEGGLGINERLTAWRLHHNVDVSNTPLYVIPEPIDLCRSDADWQLLLQRMADLPAEPRLELLVIDTVSRVMNGGNENAPDDMGRFVAHLDKLRLATKAHIMVIHHSGKDESRGARGHSLLKAAADTEIEVTANETTGERVLTVTKQRDHAVGDVFAFRLKPVDLEEGKTSCVVEVIDETAKATKAKEAKLPPNQKTMFSLLHDARGTLTTDQWNERAREAGLGVNRPATLYDLRSALKAKNLILETANGWIIKQPTGEVP